MKPPPVVAPLLGLLAGATYSHAKRAAVRFMSEEQARVYARLRRDNARAIDAWRWATAVDL